MNSTSRYTLICLAAAALLWTTATISQPDPKPAAPAPAAAATDEMKKQWVAAAAAMSATAPEHQRLADMVGTWDLTSTISFAGMASMTSNLRATSKMILGGRFLQCVAEGETGDPMKMDSLTIYGYDTRTKKYTIWGIDTSGTYSIWATGDYDAETKAITMIGENEEPGMGKYRFKWVVISEGADAWTQQVHFELGGTWSKVMEMKGKRAAAGAPEVKHSGM